MDFKLLEIPSTMQPYVKAVWLLDTSFSEKDKGFSSTHTQPLMPKEGSLIFFHRASKPITLDGKVLPPIVFQGPNTKAYEMVSSGNIKMLGVELHALTATVLFHKSYSALGLSPLTPEEIGDKAFINLGKQATCCYSLEALVPSIFEMIQSKANAYYFDELKYRAVQKVINAIGDGTIPISLQDLCKQFGLTMKTMQRYFNDLIGLSPKEYAGVVRFRTAMDAVRSCDSEERILEIAYKCGYSNPPQMVTDFKNRGALLPNAMKHLDSLTPEKFNIFHFSKSILENQRSAEEQ